MIYGLFCLVGTPTLIENTELQYEPSGGAIIFGLGVGFLIHAYLGMYVRVFADTRTLDGK